MSTVSSPKLSEETNRQIQASRKSFGEMSAPDYHTFSGGVGG